jgi:hypothetical protein
MPLDHTQRNFIAYGGPGGRGPSVPKPLGGGVTGAPSSPQHPVSGFRAAFVRRRIDGLDGCLSLRARDCKPAGREPCPA